MGVDVQIRSHSDMIGFARCPKSHYYRNVRKLQKKGRGGVMHRGTVAHRLLQDVLLGAPLEEAAATLREELLTQTLDSDQEVDVWELMEEAVQILGRFLVKYADDIAHWIVLHVEENFTLTWAIDGVEYKLGLTPDLVVQDTRTGYVWVLDFKTVQTIPTDMPLTFQDLLYAAAVRTLYPQTQGFILSYIRWKLPSVPRLAKTGKKRVAYLDTIDTTYQILSQFLEEEAPDLLEDPDHAARLSELSQKDSFFQRKMVFRSDEAIEQALVDAAAWLRAMDRAEEEGAFPRNFINNGTLSCQRCEFEPICTAELVGDVGIDGVESAFYEARQARPTYESEEE